MTTSILGLVWPSEKLWTVLSLDLVLKATLVLLLALGIVRLQKRAAAAVRHRVWSLTFCGLLLLPALAVLLPSWRLPLLPSPPVVTETEPAAVIPSEPVKNINASESKSETSHPITGPDTRSLSGNAARSCSADGRQPMGTSPFDFGAHAGTGRSSGGRGIERVSDSPD